jgi:cytochrome c peroxidase
MAARARRARGDGRGAGRVCRIALAPLLVASVFGAAASVADDIFEWRLPRGFPVPHVPADNPMSEAKVALGRRLFFDPALSFNGEMSCALCHDPALAFTDGRARAVGATGESLAHNAMPLANVAYYPSFGWKDRHVRSLEEQMRRPLFNEHPVELGLAGREREVEARLAASASYREAFGAAFPAEARPVSMDNVVRAIAAYERTLVSGESPFDRYVFEGDHAALSPEAKRGMALFFSARTACARCHSGFNFAGPWVDRGSPDTPAAFADNGLGAGAFRVPTLRNVALTAPYMHDGRFATLQAVLEHYARAGLAPPNLSADERDALIAFLETLTDTAFVRRHVMERAPR